jgi:hypothetical protein
LFGTIFRPSKKPLNANLPGPHFLKLARRGHNPLKSTNPKTLTFHSSPRKKTSQTMTDSSKNITVWVLISLLVGSALIATHFKGSHQQQLPALLRGTQSLRRLEGDTVGSGVGTGGASGSGTANTVGMGSKATIVGSGKGGAYGSGGGFATGIGGSSEAGGAGGGNADGGITATAQDDADVTNTTGYAVAAGGGGGLSFFLSAPVSKIPEVVDESSNNNGNGNDNKNNNNDNKNEVVVVPEPEPSFIPGVAGGGGGGWGFSVARGNGAASSPTIMAAPGQASAMGTGNSVGFGGGYGSAFFFGDDKAVAESAGGRGSGSAYGDAIGATGELTGEASGSGEGDGGGYATGGGGGFVAENGQTPYVYEIGTYFPGRPASPIP